MTDTQAFTPQAFAGPGQADAQQTAAAVLTELLTADGLEKNLQVGLRMDAQNYISLYALCMHLGTQGLYLDYNQIKAALKSVPGTTVSQDSERVFVLVPNRKTVVAVAALAPGLVASLKAHAAKCPAKTSGAEYREVDQTLSFKTPEEADAAALASWLKANPLEGLDLKVTVHSETFSAYLRDKYKTLAVQIETQDNMMMNMNMQFMNMYSNPQMQMMLMQMMSNPFGQGGFGAFSGQKNNLFVRKAKNKDTAGGEKKAQYSGSSSARGNYRTDRDAGYTKKSPADKPKPEKEEIARPRLDSDSFPPLSGPRKQIVSEPKAKDRDVVEGKVTAQYLIDYFNSHKGAIQISEQLNKLNTLLVPIIDKNAELRIEEINPTPRREFHAGVYNPPSGPSSRKGSTHYRIDSFNNQPTAGTKKRGPEDDEYVVKN